jgi:hypothetical protein
MFKVTLPSASTPPTLGRLRGIPCPSRPVLASLQGRPIIQACRAVNPSWNEPPALSTTTKSEGFRKTAMSGPARADKHETMTGYMHAVNHSLWRPCRQEGSGRIRGEVRSGGWIEANSSCLREDARRGDHRDCDPRKREVKFSVDERSTAVSSRRFVTIVGALSSPQAFVGRQAKTRQSSGRAEVDPGIPGRVARTSTPIPFRSSIKRGVSV